MSPPFRPYHEKSVNVRSCADAFRLPDMKLSGLLPSLLLLTDQVRDCTACLWAPRLLSAGWPYARQAEGTNCPAPGVLRRLTLGRKALPARLQKSLGSFHLYSSHEFGSHGGIGVLGTADQADYLGRLAAFYEEDAFSTQNTEEAGLLDVVNTPGRGRGLIATRTLQRGDVVMARRPVLLLDLDVYTDLDRAQWVEVHHEAVAALPLRTRSMFWQLDGAGQVDALTDRIRTNAFAVMVGDKAYHAVFPDISVRGAPH